MQQTDPLRRILIITGMSGAGITSALKVLEDAGYEMHDNYPVTQALSLVYDEEFPDKNLAIGFDTRSRGFSIDNVHEVIEALRQDKSLDARIIFLNCSDEELQRRFSETRRKHPLAADRPVVDGIIAERNMLNPMTKFVDRQINTTEMSIADFRTLLRDDYALGERREVLQVSVMSFGFKNGTPRQVDKLEDVRFFRNPHYDPGLKHKTGVEADVQAYVAADEDFEEWMQLTKAQLKLTMARVVKEGRSYFTLGIGCMGGKHRSVFIAEALTAWLKEEGYSVSVQHRDLSSSSAA